MDNNGIENGSGERRFAKRYETKEVLVYIRYLKKINWFHRFYGPFILDDIAVSSIRFHCPKNFLASSQVELKLITADRNLVIFVKGKITGKRADLFESIYEYVVQFNPYGKGLKYNSYHSKELLEFFLDSIDPNSDSLF
jgi:hypothetical protein